VDEAATFEIIDGSLERDNAPVLESIDLCIEAGEAVALVGPSGAGETTLLRLMNGSLRPSRGTVRFRGRDLATFSRRETKAMRAKSGFVHQDLGLIPNLRVVKNVLAGQLGQQGPLASLRSMLAPSRPTLVEVHALLERVGIEDKLFQRTDLLSGGEQQRVALARALYQKPVAMLADEPVSSVDPARARDTVGLLAHISKEERLTLCVSLHSLDLAQRFFPRLIGMRHGRIVFDRPSEDLHDAEFEALYNLEENLEEHFEENLHDNRDEPGRTPGVD